MYDMICLTDCYAMTYIATLTIVYARISVSQSGTILNLALSSIWFGQPSFLGLMSIAA